MRPQAAAGAGDRVWVNPARPPSAARPARGRPAFLDRGTPHVLARMPHAALMQHGQLEVVIITSTRY